MRSLADSWASAMHAYRVSRVFGLSVLQLAFFEEKATKVSHESLSQNPLPAFQLNQIRKRRGTSTRLTPRNSASRRRQRRGEGHSTCGGQHACPPALPHQGDEKLHI